MKFGCFDSALYGKTMARFWPLWGLWGAGWLVAIPLLMLNHYFDLVRFSDSLHQAREVFADTLLSIPRFLAFGVPVACVFAVLCAMAVFGYLYNNRSACMMHALPLRRESLFWTQYLAGLSFLLLPLAAVGLLTVAIEIILLPNALGQVLPPLLIFLAAMAGVCLFFFSFATFCAMFTGHILALPVFYGILNALAFVLYMLITDLMERLFYGYQAYGAADWVKYCTPLYALFEAVGWHLKQVPAGGVEMSGGSYALNSPGTVAVYAVVGILLAVVAMGVYRRRHIESAGDVVSVGIMRPVFKYGVAFCTGLCLGVWTSAIFGWYLKSPALVVAVLAWAAVGYWAAEMLLKKSFRVWKAWKGCVAVVAAMGLLCAACAFDWFGVEVRLPAVEQVDKVYLDCSGGGYPHDSGVLEQELTGSKQIAQVISLHQAAIEERTREEGVLEGPFEYTTVHIQYTLKNGSEMARRYILPILREDLQREGSFTQQLQRLLEDRELTRLAYGFDQAENWRLDDVNLDYIYNIGDNSWHSIGIEESTADRLELWQAVIQDFEEGTLGRHTLFYEDSVSAAYGDAPELVFFWETAPKRTEGGEAASSYKRISIALTPEARHTMDWLSKHNVPGEAYEVFHKN